MTKFEDTAPQAGERIDLSRRHLLAASAGLTLGAVVAPAVASAQDHQGMHMGTAPGTSLSDRLYNINIRDGFADIAHDPADIPPPITRRTPEKLVVELETVELEARLDEKTTVVSPDVV